MARIVKAELLQPFLTVVSFAPTASHNFDVPVGLVACAIGSLTAGARELPSDTEKQLSAIAEAFAADRSTQAYWGDPGRHKQLLKLLRDGEDVQVVLEAMAPEFMVELTTYLEPGDAAWVLDPVGEPADIIARVRQAAGACARHYQPAPGRRTDIALEAAVRALVGLIEPTLGLRLTIARNKNNGGRGPTPNCAGTRAIDLLLRGIDSQHTTTTAIMNMIDTVRCKPEPAEGHLMELFRSSPIHALDASLLPGREESIRRIRADPNFGFA
ncbi:hypothetical protein [Sphingomonas sp. GC_Shp_3]|uniref:hypothetical protein n=1 Tax=Sphingomonas sp. GC_Shp_3 TaxID=2937383 RepID=UPI00226A2667|nr:hypothetical protein [Sphingomonas sp. GC_Shp_3]